MSHKDTYTKERHFGIYGGRYVPEMLIPALDQLEKAYFGMKDDPGFKNDLDDLLRHYAGRPTPLYFAENLSHQLKGCRIYLKMEGLAHTGAHKINNVLGQALLAQKMGKTTLVAETGAGQHGLATATAAARFNMKCKVFMGEVDVKRQYPNVYAMKLLGAEVIPVPYGTKILKDAVNAALKYWIENLSDTHYLIGSALGPFPYPLMVRNFQSVIGNEILNQIGQREENLPDVMIASVGGGSNSIGMFYPFIDNKSVRLIGVEAGGSGPGEGNNAVRFGPHGNTGILEGYKSYFLQNSDGQIMDTHSISAGLDYAGIGPELAHLHDSGRVTFEHVTDREVLEAFKKLAQSEGIIPALESSHAVAYAIKLAPTLSRDQVMVINISGRGDKDIFITAPHLDRENWMTFLKTEVQNDKQN